jgi:hypothetical protein
MNLPFLRLCFWSNRRCAYVGLVLGTLLVIPGCGPSELTIRKKESYADLVVIYNSETQELESLEKKRKGMLDEFAKKAQEQAIQSLAGSLESLAGKPASNPNNALDQAVLAAEAQAKLLNSITKPNDAPLPFTEEQKQQLLALDSEIEKQKERVQRAKEKRDTAEANRE